MNNHNTGHTTIHRVGSGVTQFLTWPMHAVGDALKLRRLRRRLPKVHRRLISTPKGIRTETDAEYLDRLREIDMERAVRRMTR